MKNDYIEKIIANINSDDRNIMKFGLFKLRSLLLENDFSFMTEVSNWSIIPKLFEVLESNITDYIIIVKKLNLI